MAALREINNDDRTRSSLARSEYIRGYPLTVFVLVPLEALWSDLPGLPHHQEILDKGRYRQ
jgi:hypothetical protein